MLYFIVAINNIISFSDNNDDIKSQTNEHLRKIKSMPEFPDDASGKALTESEKKHVLEELTASQVPSPKKEPAKSVILDIKVTKLSEKSTDAGQLSPPVMFDSPKHDSRDQRSSRGSSSTTSFVSIPEDSIPQEGRRSTPGAAKSSARSSLYGSVFGKEGPTQGGMNPSFLFLQLYHANFFDSTDERPLRLPNDEVSRHVLSYIPESVISCTVKFP